MSTHAHHRLVHLAEGAFHIKEAKTSVGVLRYSHHETVAIIDSTQAGKTAHDVVGVGGKAPVVASLKEALQYKPDTLLIGIAPAGGALPVAWRAIILEAIQNGMQIWNGLHTFLAHDREFASAAERHGVRLWDVRKPPSDLPISKWRCRDARSYISLMVGSDCAVGKMTAALEIEKVAEKRGVNAEFVATGQTGIMIAGWGSPVDAIPGDFMAGCVERDCMEVDGKCDVILVEGQGSLLHPAYSPVTLGLIHGCAPDSMIVCHVATRKQIARGYPVDIPPMSKVGEIHAQAAAWLKPTKVIGVSVATYDIPDEKVAREAVRAIAEETGLPTTDPVRFGAEPLFDAIEKHRKEIGKPRK